MRTSRAIAVVLPFLLGLATAVESQEKLATTIGLLAAPHGQGPLLAASLLVAGQFPQPGEIAKLIKDLGDEDFQVREKATKRLTEIGVSALDALREAQAKGDAETSKRSELLIRSIGVLHHLPTHVKGMEFKLILMDDEWSIPNPGARTPIKVNLEITNTTDEAYRLFLYDAVKVVLQDSSHNNIRVSGGREHPNPLEKISPPLKKNQTYTLTLQGERWRSGNKLAFYLRDPYNRYWKAEGLPKGTYYLGLVYEYSKATTDLKPPLWVGRAETLLETVEIQ